MKRSLSFPSEQLLGWKANSPPRCLPSPRCVFSEIHTGFSVEVSGICLEPLQPEPPWCRVVGECVCGSVSECVCVCICSRQGRDGRVLKTKLRSPGGFPNIKLLKEVFFPLPFDPMSQDVVCREVGDGEEKKRAQVLQLGRAARPQLSPALACLPCLSAPRWDRTSQEWASEWRFWGGVILKCQLCFPRLQTVTRSVV